MWIAQVLYRNPVPIQTSCVTSIAQGISDRFSALGPIMESHSYTDVRLLPSLYSRCWAVHEYEAQHTSVSIHVRSFSSSASSSLPHHLTVPLMSQPWMRPMFFIVLVSQEVHTQGHSQDPLFLPEFIFNSTTGLQGCRDTRDSKALSCQDCTAQLCFPLALGRAGFAAFVGTSCLLYSVSWFRLGHI